MLTCPFCGKDAEGYNDHSYCPHCDRSYFYVGTKLWYCHGKERDDDNARTDIPNLDKVC